MGRRIHPTLLVAVIIASGNLLSLARTWTSDDGKTIEADYLSSTHDSVRLLHEGREVVLPLTRLSAEDQGWVKLQNVSQQLPPAAETASPGKLRAYGELSSESAKELKDLLVDREQLSSRIDRIMQLTVEAFGSSGPSGLPVTWEALNREEIDGYIEGCQFAVVMHHSFSGEPVARVGIRYTTDVSMKKNREAAREVTTLPGVGILRIARPDKDFDLDHVMGREFSLRCERATLCFEILEPGYEDHRALQRFLRRFDLRAISSL